jgi:Ni,Fe-hydrogenase III large subunit
MFGLVPQGHPDPRRVALHRNWPEDLRPLRRDFDAFDEPPFTSDDEEFRNRTQGEGILEIPVGPIHAGIIEPGHFRFSAVGEQIVNLEARFFYTHRGVEKQCEGLPVERALYLVERNCAVCSVSSVLAYCQALESLAGIEPPESALYLRLVYAELERLYNHVGDIGNICAGIGFHAGSQGGLALKEELLALNERLVGNRYLFGVVRPGGVGPGLDSLGRWSLREEMWQLRERFSRLVELILNNDGVVDRFATTGVLLPSSAQNLGVVGVAARASGVDRDVRRDHPYAAYGQLPPRAIPVFQSGDVYARFGVRVEEVKTSAELILGALDKLEELPPGPLSVPLRELPAYRSAFGLTESARGANCHWLMTGPGNRLYRYRIRTASYANWPVVPRAVLNNIVPDFPLINKSFELCYSCLDR